MPPPGASSSSNRTVPGVAPPTVTAPAPEVTASVQPVPVKTSVAPPETSSEASGFASEEPRVTVAAAEIVAESPFLLPGTPFGVHWDELVHAPEPLLQT